MKKIIISALDEQFKKDCKVINLKYEYPGYIGNAKYGVITALTEDKLNQRYAAQLGEYRPYIVLSPAFGEIRAEFVRNEKKHAMRQQRSENLFGYDEKTELLNPECQVQDYLTDIIAKSDEEHEKSLLLDAMSTLTETEKSRIVQHYCFGLSEREIAEQEGKSKNAVHLSLCSGIKKLKEFFKST